MNNSENIYKNDINANRDISDGIIHIAFKGNRRKSYKNPYEFPFKKGDLAIVAADRGNDAGTVKHITKKLPNCPKSRPKYDVIRLGNSKDKERQNWLAEKEKNAFLICNEKIEEFSLPMKLVDSEYRFDGLKLNFFFKAKSHVDFRELVKDLLMNYGLSE